MSTVTPNEPFRFLDLAAELRDEVYRHVIPTSEITLVAACEQNEDGELAWTFGYNANAADVLPLFALRDTCAQIRGEFDNIFGKCAKVGVLNSSNYDRPLGGSRKIYAPASLLRGVRDITLATKYMIVRYMGGGRAEGFPTKAIVRVDTSKGNVPEAVRWAHSLDQPTYIMPRVPPRHQAFCDDYKEVTEQAMRQALSRGCSSFDIICAGLSALSPGMWSMPQKGDVRSSEEKHETARQLVQWASGCLKDAEEIVKYDKGDKEDKDDEDNEDDDDDDGNAGISWEFQAHDEDRLRKFCAAIGLEKNTKAKDANLSTRGPRRSHPGIFKQ